VTYFLVELRSPAGGHLIRCNGNEFIWDAAARFHVPLPAICHQGQCLTCAARLIKGAVDQSAAATYFNADRDAGFVLLCTARPLSNVICQTDQQAAMRAHRQALGLPAPYG
jgi:ferredoxin